MIVWLIGLSGAGKTALGKRIVDLQRRAAPHTVFLDGDVVRSVMGNDVGHSIEDRRRNGERISKLCYELDRQGIDVVCAILSIFHDQQQWNRENISDYREVYIKTSMDTVQRRDAKGLYKKALSGEIKDVVGVDIEFPPPLAPDLVIENDDDSGLEEKARKILETFSMQGASAYPYSSINRLQHPTKYEYSLYEGPVLLENYLKSREATLKNVSGRFEKLLELYGNAETAHPWVQPLGWPVKASVFLRKELPQTGVRPGESIHTRTFLTTILDGLLGGAGTVPPPEILRLVQRFEVSKKLYTEYAFPEFRKKTDTFEDLLNYALFSLIVQRFYSAGDEPARYLFLNAAVKVNDVLESVQSSLSTPLEYGLATLVFKGEIALYSKLEREKLK